MKESKHKLTPQEESRILNLMNQLEYVDQAPAQIVADLADKGIYLASVSTFYRILHKNKALQHRQTTRKPRSYTITSWRAIKPNQVWSWDISFVKTHTKGKFLYLYLIMDIFSRKIISWAVHEQESAEIASSVLHSAYLQEDVAPSQLVLHSDNGGPMKGAPMLATMQKLGIIKSFSRPRVSNDNPYSESLFKTLKYKPGYPKKGFSDRQEAETWMNEFVDWYNHKHKHSGISFITPNTRHQGRDQEQLTHRQLVYEMAKNAHPERFKNGIKQWIYIDAVDLNPGKTSFTQQTLHLD